MPLLAEWLMREEKLFNDLPQRGNQSLVMILAAKDYLSAHEQLQRERRKHVKTKAKPRNINNPITLTITISIHISLIQYSCVTHLREIIQNISLSFVRENNKCRNRQRRASHQADSR